MVIGQWTYKLAGNIQKAIDGYKIIEKHFSNHGAIGSALVSSHGTDTGTFSTMIGYENYEQFGLIDDKISQDENFNNEMNPYFEITSWEKMNFAEPMMHKMEPDPGVKNCFAAWTFHHKNIDMIMKKSEIFLSYGWMLEQMVAVLEDTMAMIVDTILLRHVSKHDRLWKSSG